MKLVPEPFPEYLRAEHEGGHQTILRPGDASVFFSSRGLVPAAIGQGFLREIPPHKQFTLGMDAMQAGGLDRAELLGWRFFEWSETGDLAARLLAPEPRSPEVVRSDSYFFNFNIGPFVRRSADVFAQARASQLPGSYRFRFLLLPQVYVAAVWLFREEGEGPQHLLYPLGRPTAPNDGPPVGGGLQPPAPATENQFFSELKYVIMQMKGNAPAPRRGDDHGKSDSGDRSASSAG